MKRQRRDTGHIGLVMSAWGLLFSELLLSCPPPPCPPCHVWVPPNCVYRCTGCESCKNNSCVVCGGIEGLACCDGIECYDTKIEHCCNYGTGIYCDNGIDCCANNCCSEDQPTCCDDTTCYDDPMTQQCCGFGTGVVCREFCCDDWSCQRCDWATGSCQPSLQKAVDYGHLLLCQGSIVPDPNHTPSTNGCGPDGWKGQIVPDNPGGFPFETCCDSHDICYGTCHSTQAGCDFAFHTCMTGLCSGYPFPLYDICIVFATAYYEAVHNFGYEHWSEGQTDACVCCGELLSY